MVKRNILLVAAALLFTCCGKDPVITKYRTENVVVIVVDGARYTETWGLPGRTFIPNRNALLSQGVLCSNLLNEGVTSTTPGHTAMCTGVYQVIDNGGNEYPAYPSLFQYWLKAQGKPSTSAWIIATKDKLEVLSDCLDPQWHGRYRPSTDCGISGLGTGYREDSTTFKKVKQVMYAYHPRLMLVNFKQPDAAGHANDSAGYLSGIAQTDQYIAEIWSRIQSDEFYKDKTTLIVTNDHGRHDAGHLDGFVSHGDGCYGCRHVELFALGPDFKKNYVSTKACSQVDIASTISELMGIAIPTASGKVIRDIFLH